MLIEVVVSIQHKALGLHLWVTSSSPCFLDIVLQRVTDIIVHYQAHVFLVNPHSKRRGGDNHLYLAAHEGILVFHLLGSIHLAVIGQCPYAVADQMLRQFASASCS